jgi:hypothetical protein
MERFAINPIIKNRYEKTIGHHQPSITTETFKPLPLLSYYRDFFRAIILDSCMRGFKLEKFNVSHCQGPFLGELSMECELSVANEVETEGIP